MEPPIDSPADLANSKIHWAGSHEALIYSIMGTDEPIMMKLVDNFEVHPMAKLPDVGRLGTVGLVIEHLDYQFFGYNAYVTPETMQKMRPMRGDVMYGPVAAATARNWYLKDELDEFILRVAQSGIQNYWLLDSTYRLLDPSVQMAMKLSHGHNADDSGHAEPLKIQRFVGIFYTYALGLILAVVVFVGELVHYKYRQVLLRGRGGRK